LTSTVGGGEWLASCPGRITPTKIVPYIHLDKSLGGPRVCLDTVKKRKILPLPGTEPRLSSL
jgi:hypothetical protein